MEFIDGDTRLRGSAKALDIWRLERKVELLFEQLLEVLKDCHGPDGVPLGRHCF